MNNNRLLSLRNNGPLKFRNNATFERFPTPVFSHFLGHFMVILKKKVDNQFSFGWNFDLNRFTNCRE